MIIGMLKMAAKLQELCFNGLCCEDFFGRLHGKNHNKVAFKKLLIKKQTLICEPAPACWLISSK